MRTPNVSIRNWRAATKSALVIVDMVNDFVDGVLANPGASEIVEPIATLANSAHLSTEWLVVYANDAHLPDDVELRVFPPHAMAGTPGAEVVADLRPWEADLVVPKRFYSAFTETGLDSLLRAHGVGRLILAGQHTDCCIRHTAYDAFRLGYALTICPEATTVFQPGSDESVGGRQQRALSYLVTYYGAKLEGLDTIG